MPNTAVNQSIEQWWVEDAERLNDLAKVAEGAGTVVGTTPIPPKLNADGSLAKE